MITVWHRVIVLLAGFMLAYAGAKAETPASDAVAARQRAGTTVARCALQEFVRACARNARAQCERADSKVSPTPRPRTTSNGYTPGTLTFSASMKQKIGKYRDPDTGGIVTQVYRLIQFSGTLFMSFKDFDPARLDFAFGPGQSFSFSISDPVGYRDVFYDSLLGGAPYCGRNRANWEDIFAGNAQDAWHDYYPIVFEDYLSLTWSTSGVKVKFAFKGMGSPELGTVPPMFGPQESLGPIYRTTTADMMFGDLTTLFQSVALSGRYAGDPEGRCTWSVKGVGKATGNEQP